MVLKCKSIDVIAVKCNTRDLKSFGCYDDWNVLLKWKHESCMLEKRLLVSTSSAEMLSMKKTRKMEHLSSNFKACSLIL